jgi:hypothetical protein
MFMVGFSRLSPCQRILRFSMIVAGSLFSHSGNLPETGLSLQK